MVIVLRRKTQQNLEYFAMKTQFHNLLKTATFRQLQVFDTIAKKGNFTAAAQELYLAQPTVSMQMKKLTDDIGMPLFEQIGRKVYLTEAGKELLATCEAIFSSVEEFNTRIANKKGIKEGNLHLAGVTTTEYFAPLILGIFYQRHPEIKVSLKITDRETLVQRLDRNKDDIYIVDHLSHNKDIEIIPFVENPLVVVAPPNHYLAAKKKLSIHDLAQEHFLVREPDSGTRIVLDNFLGEKNASLRIRMELSSNEALKRSVMAGLGIAVLSQHAVFEECANGALAILNVTGFPLCNHWYSVYPKNKMLSDVAAAFLEFLKKEAKHYIEASIKTDVKKRPNIKLINKSDYRSPRRRRVVT